MVNERFVDITTGNDGDDGETEGNAWQHLYFARQQTAADMLVYVKGSASYTDEDTVGGARDCVLYIDQAGGVDDGIKWEGYTTTPGDNGVFTIDCTTDALANGINFATGASCYNAVKNCRVTQATGAGFYTSADDWGLLWNVRADNCGGGGINVDNYWLIINPQTDNNTGDGIGCDVECIIVNPVSFTNSNSGINIDRGVVINPLIYNNGAGATAGGIRLVGDLCVVYGGSVDCDNNATALGIWGSSTYGSIAIINTILFDCGTALSLGGDNANFNTALNNLFFSNDTDRTNFPTGDNEIAGSSDPFNDSTGRDYRLIKNSEARKAGIDAQSTTKFWNSFADGVNPPDPGAGSYADIGAMQAEPGTVILGGILKATAFPNFPITMLQSSDGITPRVGGTVVVQRSIDGAAFVNVTNTPATEVGSGLYVIDLEIADMDGDTISLICTDGSSVTKFITIKTRVE